MKELTQEERQELEMLKASEEVKLANREIQKKYQKPYQNKERKKLHHYRWLHKKGLAIKAQQAGEVNAWNERTIRGA